MCDYWGGGEKRETHLARTKKKNNTIRRGWRWVMRYGGFPGMLSHSRTSKVKVSAE